MNKKLFNKRFWTLSGIVLAAAFARFIPHPPNFAPIAAIALFGGAYFDNKKLSFVVPFAAMILSDIFMPLHSTVWAVYLSFALIVLIGFSLRERKKVKNIILASIASSVLFFAVTNFAVWMSYRMYPMNLTGLAECYVAAIPFFSYTLLGDLFFVGLLFGIFEILKAKVPELAKI
ncbi:MAG TPA: DUF6580 family putative transport protein [Ignavibacteriaceae bacterium]|nr:DUF6580 family putative transport protein [Ignavibacteriaceae bacterium]